MPSQIVFSQIGLGGVLKQYQLEVPPNQREYAWGEDEVSQLLQDYAAAVSDDGADYFLGTIVTIPRGNNILEVVDGQQRLATTALLLAAIRDYLADRNEEIVVESINNGFLNGSDLQQRARVPKLKLNVDDNDLFKAIVSVTAPMGLLEPTRPSHERLLAAYREAQQQVRRIVAPHDPNTHGDVLVRWISFIEFNALAVLLRVPDDADAYRMFETLNDRGLRTSQADLIKNHLFAKSGDRFSEVQNRWSYMRGALESLDDPDITINFLRHALVLMRGYLSAKKVYETVQEIARAEQSTVTFTGHLETQANVYVATFNPEHELWNDYPQATRLAIEVFNLIDVKPLRALLLAIGGRFNPQETAKAYSYLVSLAVRLLIAATVRSGSVEQPLSTAAKEVFDGNITTAAELETQLKALAPSDRQFQEAFERARTTSAKFGRYYLRSLEMAAKSEPEPYFIPQDDRSVINLEHVLPLKPEDNWPHVTNEDVDQYAKRLGNLVLMRATDNSHLRSDGFEAKREVYAASPYLLTSQVAEQTEWTPEAITSRQKQLATLAVVTWPIA